MSIQNEQEEDGKPVPLRQKDWCHIFLQYIDLFSQPVCFFIFSCNIVLAKPEVILDNFEILHVIFYIYYALFANNNSHQICKLFLLLLTVIHQTIDYPFLNK